MVYPNPASTHTRFAFDLARREHVSVRIYNARGQLIKDLVDHWLPAGHHQVQWLGSDAKGSRVSHGVYLAVFRAGDITATREVSLLP